jgi:hypothetical protein
MRFSRLPIGFVFDFVDPSSFRNSFFDRCIKLSKRTYKSLDSGTVYTVGNVRAEVFHVNPPPQLTPRAGFRFRHARVLSADGMTGQVFEVTRVANETVYYRAVYPNGDTHVLGSPQCCPFDEFPKWVKEEAL